MDCAIEILRRYLLQQLPRAYNRFLKPALRSELLQTFNCVRLIDREITGTSSPQRRKYSAAAEMLSQIVSDATHVSTGRASHKNLYFGSGDALHIELSHFDLHWGQFDRNSLSRQFVRRHATDFFGRDGWRRLEKKTAEAIECG